MKPSIKTTKYTNEMLKLWWLHHYENLLFRRGTAIWYTKWGLKLPSWDLSFETIAPALALSRSCQTPKVTNPSKIITTAVVLCNNINKLLSDGHFLSIMVHTQLVRICLRGLMALSLRPHVIDWQVRGEKSLFWNWGINCPKRFLSC